MKDLVRDFNLANGCDKEAKRWCVESAGRSCFLPWLLSSCLHFAGNFLDLYFIHPPTSSNPGLALHIKRRKVLLPAAVSRFIVQSSDIFYSYFSLNGDQRQFF